MPVIARGLPALLSLFIRSGPGKKLYKQLRKQGLNRDEATEGLKQQLNKSVVNNPGVKQRLEALEAGTLVEKTQAEILAEKIAARKKLSQRTKEEKKSSFQPFGGTSLSQRYQGVGKDKLWRDNMVDNISASIKAKQFKGKNKEYLDKLKTKLQDPDSQFSKGELAFLAKYIDKTKTTSLQPPSPVVIQEDLFDVGKSKYFKADEPIKRRTRTPQPRNIRAFNQQHIIKELEDVEEKLAIAKINASVKNPLVEDIEELGRLQRRQAELSEHIIQFDMFDTAGASAAKRAMKEKDRLKKLRKIQKRRQLNEMEQMEAARLEANRLALQEERMARGYGLPRDEYGQAWNPREFGLKNYDPAYRGTPWREVHRKGWTDLKPIHRGAGSPPNTRLTLPEYSDEIGPPAGKYLHRAGPSGATVPGLGTGGGRIVEHTKIADAVGAAPMFATNRIPAELTQTGMTKAEFTALSDKLKQGGMSQWEFAKEIQKAKDLIKTRTTTPSAAQKIVGPHENVGAHARNTISFADGTTMNRADFRKLPPMERLGMLHKSFVATSPKGQGFKNLTRQKERLDELKKPKEWWDTGAPPRAPTRDSYFGVSRGQEIRQGKIAEKEFFEKALKLTPEQRASLTKSEANAIYHYVVHPYKGPKTPEEALEAITAVRKLNQAQPGVGTELLEMLRGTPSWHSIHDLLGANPGLGQYVPRKRWAKGGPVDKNWIQKVRSRIKKKGTEGVCTGEKYGSSSCPPGSKRYNLAKTFRSMNRKRA